jgi:hypothetical protein
MSRVENFFQVYKPRSWNSPIWTVNNKLQDYRTFFHNLSFIFIIWCLSCKKIHLSVVNKWINISFTLNTFQYSTIAWFLCKLTFMKLWIFLRPSWAAILFTELEWVSRPRHTLPDTLLCVRLCNLEMMTKKSTKPLPDIICIQLFFSLTLAHCAHYHFHRFYASTGSIKGADNSKLRKTILLWCLQYLTSTSLHGWTSQL